VVYNNVTLENSSRSLLRPLPLLYDKERTRIAHSRTTTFFLISTSKTWTNRASYLDQTQLQFFPKAWQINGILTGGCACTRLNPTRKRIGTCMLSMSLNARNPISCELSKRALGRLKALADHEHTCFSGSWWKLRQRRIGSFSDNIHSVRPSPPLVFSHYSSLFIFPSNHIIGNKFLVLHDSHEKDYLFFSKTRHDRLPPPSMRTGIKSFNWYWDDVLPTGKILVNNVKSGFDASLQNNSTPCGLGN
jgi:hypothetical protein